MSGARPVVTDERAPSLPALELPDDRLTDLGAALRVEWLETNGLGSFACGTVAGPATRRYHAHLCVATRPPLGRMVLLNDLEQTVIAGGVEHALSSHLYPGAIFPDGHRALTAFRLAPWPTWTFRCGALTVERELFLAHGLQAAFLRWRVRGGGATLRLRPLCSGRDYHATHHENSAAGAPPLVEEGRVSLALYPGVPALHLHHPGRWRTDPRWYRRVQLPRERERGLDSEEDLFAPGELEIAVADGEVAAIVAATDARPWWNVELVASTERARRVAVATSLPRGDNATVSRLALAADQFLVERAGGATVIAGYPWFTDWGRDTFIALPGLTLATGRLAIARALLDAFAAHVDGGMIPNRFPDAGEAPEYNSVDAPLWYCVAAAQYLAAAPPSSDAFARDRLWPAVRAIIEGYRRGTRFNIGLDDDGLIHAGAPGVQLTWMDAKVGDWVVTPRAGKPIEIQALWLRALQGAIDLANRFESAALAVELDGLRALAARSIADRFWYEQGGYLLDVIDTPGDGARRDASLRPNQLYALAASRHGGPGSEPLIDPAHAAHALDAVERHLLTPVGVRTLAPADGAYRGRCTGSQHDRDAAYHNGTAWPHLLGVYADACLRVRGERVGRALVRRLSGHLLDGGFGQVSEIFDGDSPHEPRGCFAQAWAVAELLRLEVGP